MMKLTAITAPLCLSIMAATQVLATVPAPPPDLQPAVPQPLKLT
jgi:hypothetical protein